MIAGKLISFATLKKITFQSNVSWSFYLFQGNLRYELVGIYPAQDFFAVDPSSGEVSVIRNLTTDNFETMQYTVSTETSVLSK